jgi:exodeoxyribonuclease VII small subunit
MTRKTKSVDFEQALRELETLVEKLEHGDLPLEESLRHFERGVALTRECQAALKAAEARVELLTRRRDAASAAGDAPAAETLEPFAASGEQADDA